MNKLGLYEDVFFDCIGSSSNKTTLQSLSNISSFSFPNSYDYLNSNNKLDVLCELDCYHSSSNKATQLPFDNILNRLDDNSFDYLNSNNDLDLREDTLLDCYQSSLNKATQLSFDTILNRLDESFKDPNELEIFESRKSSFFTSFHDPLHYFDLPFSYISSMNSYIRNSLWSSQSFAPTTKNVRKIFMNDVFNRFKFLPYLFYLVVSLNITNTDGAHLSANGYGSNENLVNYLMTRFEFAPWIERESNGISEMSDFNLNGQDGNQLIQINFCDELDKKTKSLIIESRFDNLENRYLNLISTPDLNFVHGGHEEYQIINIIRYIIDHKSIEKDQAGICKRSMSAVQMHFSLESSFPIMTTNSVSWSDICGEFLWFIKSYSDEKRCNYMGIECSSYDNLNIRWKTYGSTYTGLDFAGRGTSFISLEEIIEIIKTRGEEIILSFPSSALSIQFYVTCADKNDVDKRNLLTGLLYRQSADVGYRVPFDIASYALFTCIIAKIANLRPYRFSYFLDEAFVYESHVDLLCKQLKNTPVAFPTLRINTQINDITSLKYNDFDLINY